MKSVKTYNIQSGKRAINFVIALVISNNETVRKFMLSFC